MMHAHLQGMHLGLQVQVEGAHLRLQLPHQPVHLCARVRPLVESR